MLPLYFFQENIRVTEFKQQYCAAAGYELVPYRPEYRDETTVILMYAPVKVPGSEYVAPEHVWKRYFSIYRPQVKIIQATSADPGTPNIFQWFAPPPDFNAFLAQCLPVTEWEPVETHARRLEELWRRFWDGHDKNGFGYHFSSAKRSIQMANDHLLEGEQELDNTVFFIEDSNIIQQLDKCRERWATYYDYWTSLPFFHDFKQLNVSVEDFSLSLPTLKSYKDLKIRTTDLRHKLEMTHQQLEIIATYFGVKIEKT
jgi:hypothetical protein